MAENISSIEYTFAHRFINELDTRGRINEAPVIMTLVSEAYDGPVLYEIEDQDVAKKHITFVKECIGLFEQNASFSISQFLHHAQELYEHYKDTLDVHLLSDVSYGDPIKKSLGDFCAQFCHSKSYVIHEKITEDHGGGFIIRFKDYRYDASYSRQLKTIR